MAVRSAGLERSEEIDGHVWTRLVWVTTRHTLTSVKSNWSRALMARVEKQTFRRVGLALGRSG